MFCAVFSPISGISVSSSKVARIIASIDVNRLQIVFEDLTQISDIGEKTAQNIVDFFKRQENKELVAELIELGLNDKAEEMELNNS
ncbi:MAG: hypothetical protein J6R66_04275, partial [Clostridia bacterium]|nr:hypothetical protein [Clostridia bacterium]